jgi:hypothetical protein
VKRHDEYAGAEMTHTTDPMTLLATQVGVASL